MCLAVPAQVVKIDGDNAEVSLGGVSRNVVLSLIDEDVQVGDYVLMHSGFAIHKMDYELAKESLNTWRELLDEDD